MSCGPCEERKGKGKGMTRGEFIGVGAAAAAGMGTVGMVEAEEAPQHDCDKPTLCGRNATLDWQIPASVLQVIWGDILPRFAAYHWVHSKYPDPLPPNSGNVSSQDLIDALHQYISELPPFARTSAVVVDSFGVPVVPTRCDLTVPDLTPFERRANFVIKKMGPPTNARIPIRLLGQGGFDFILSDAGLDLFAPKKPEDPADLLRYYQYRAAGRPAIGIPGYLDDVDALAFDVQAPVGPSQIWIDDNGFSLTPLRIGDACALDDLQCLDAEDVDPEEARAPSWPYGPSVKRFTIQGFLAAAAKVRCWQLEGSVYRGIIEQLPRVVATVWREQATGCIGGNSYAARFDDPVKMREIFEERLESKLPRESDMVFRTPQTGSPVLDDVMVSNQGLRFPHAGAAPTFSSMLNAIAQGRAGNPVFTDSKRPDRGN